MHRWALRIGQVDSMREWVQRLEARSSAWFVSATALTAVIVVFCGGSLGGNAPTVGQSEPLALTLSAPQTCETEFGGEAFGVRVDSAGRSEHYSIGWYVPGEAEVTWTASGGAPPYTLTIDGETRDGTGAFRGASGAGIVSCALTHGLAVPTRGSLLDTSDGGSDIAASGRYFSEEPEVDSGLKTIHATVTDSTGGTAEASVNLYVILEVGGSGDIMEGGKTYRLFGDLMTIPEGIDVEIGGFVSTDGGGGLSFDLNIVNHDAWVFIEIWPSGLRVLGRDIPPTSATGTNAGLDLNAKVDELTELIGRPPTFSSSSP